MTPTKAAIDAGVAALDKQRYGSHGIIAHGPNAVTAIYEAMSAAMEAEQQGVPLGMVRVGTKEEMSAHWAAIHRMQKQNGEPPTGDE